MLNKTMLQGRLTATPQTENRGGFSICEFTVAWSDKYKEVEKKCFLRCKAWRNTADFLSKYFTKGQEIVVEGNLETDSWEKDGQKQSRTVLNVEKVHFAGSKASNTDNNAPVPNADDFNAIPEGIEEELPFN